MAFDAFMSYSHAADGQLAPALQRGLHTLNRPWYRKRALRIFRDKTSLSANPALWPSIERALSESAYFLLLASPGAASSTWVAAEVNWWLAHRDINTLLIVLTDGELVWDGAKGDFDWQRTTAVPRDLSGRFSSEPLHVDVRWARTVNDLSVRHTQFRAAILDLAAPLHGIPKDELDGEDVRQYRRMKQVRFVAVTALIAFATIAVWQAVVARMQANRAVAQRLAAQADLSRRDGAFSCLDRAALLAVSSLSMTPLLETNRLVQELLPALPIASMQSRGGGQRSIVSPSGRHAAIQGQNGVTRIHDLATGQELPALEHTAKPGLLHFDATGATLTSVLPVDDTTSRLRTINLSTLGVTDHPAIAGSVIAIATRADRASLAAVVSSGSVSVIDARTGEVRATVADMLRDTRAQFSHSGKYVAIGFGDLLQSAGAVYLVDTMTGESRTLRFEMPVGTLTFSPDDKYLGITEQGFWGRRQPNTYLVDVANGAIQGTIAVPLGTGTLSFSPNGQLLALAGQQGLDIVRVPSGTRVSSLLVSGVSAVAFTPDSASLVVGTASTNLPKIAQSVGDEEELGLREDYCDLGRLRLFDAASGAERTVLDRKADASQMVFSPDGQRLIIAGARAGGATTIDAFEYSGFGSPVPLPELQKLAATRPEIEGFVAQTTPDGKYMVTIGGRQLLAVFESATGKAIQISDVPTIGGPVSLSHDGRHLALTTVADVESGGNPGEMRVVVRVYDTATMKVTREMTLSDIPLLVQIDNAAQRLLTVDLDGKLHVADLSTKASMVVGEVEGGEGIPVALSADGTMLAMPGDGAIQVRDLARNTTSARLKSSQMAAVVRFSPDGAHVATAGGIESFGLGGRGRVNVFDVSSERVVLDIPYEGGLPALSFSADGSIVIVRLATATVRLFRLSDGAELTRFAVPGDVASVALADGDSRMLIVSSPKDDELPRLYSRYLRPSDLITTVCSRLTRNLTWDEWTQFFGDASYQKSCQQLPCPAGAKARGSNSCVRE